MKYLKKYKKTDLLFFIIILILSVSGYLFTKFNDDLYKTEIMKITKIEIKNQETSTNSLGLTEIYYEKEITGVITNGINKKKEKSVIYEETYSKIVTEKYHKNDKVFIKNDNIEGLKRDTYLSILIIIFVISISIVGKIRGCLAVFSVVVNTLIFYFGLDLYFKGMNLLFLCLVESLIFTCFSLLIAEGKNKKTLTSIISVIISMIILFIETLIITKATNYSGISFNDMSFLTVPVEDVFLAEIMIGGLGAIMDIAITISSSIAELIEKDKNITTKTLTKSGREIGKDVMGTMINVLFFTYLCSGLPIFTLAIRNGYTVRNYITTNFSIEITRFLVGSIGIVIAIPISLFIAIIVFKKGKNHE